MVDVPALIVNGDGLELFAVQPPETLIVEEPKFSTRVIVLQLGSDVNVDHVQVVPFVFKVPLFKLIVELIDLFAFKFTIAPAPFMVIPLLVPDDVA